MKPKTLTNPVKSPKITSPHPASAQTPSVAVSEPSANLRCIASVLLAKLRVEVALLPENHTPLRNRDGGNDHKQHPRRFSCERDADVQESERQVCRIATKTERTSCDESGGGLACVEGCMRLRQGPERGHHQGDGGCNTC